MKDKRIQRNKNLIVTIFNNTAIFYNKDTLDNLNEMTIMTLYPSPPTPMITAIQAILDLKNLKKIEIFKNFKIKVSTLFSKDKFFYVGFDNGLIQAFLFSGTNFKKQQEIKHSKPILSLIILIIQRNIDFNNPKIYFNKYLYCVENNNIFVQTKDVFGCVFSSKYNVEDIVFSELDGYLYITTNNNDIKPTTNKMYVVDISTSEIVSEYNLNEFVVFKDFLINLTNASETLNSSRDLNGVSISNDLNEVAVQRRQTFRGLQVQNTNKFNNSNTNNTNTSNNGNPYDSDLNSYNACGNNSSNSNGNSFDNNYTYNGYTFNGNNFLFITSSGSGKLLFYSLQGFMISIESSISNLIQISYHDNSIEPIEIKDTDKCYILQ